LAATHGCGPLYCLSTEADPNAPFAVLSHGLLRWISEVAGDDQIHTNNVVAIDHLLASVLASVCL
jgi:hypothetical protein